MPIDFTTGMVVSDAVGNFNLHCDAVRFRDNLQGFKDWVFKEGSTFWEVNCRDGEDGTLGGIPDEQKPILKTRTKLMIELSEERRTETTTHYASVHA